MSLSPNKKINSSEYLGFLLDSPRRVGLYHCHGAGMAAIFDLGHLVVCYWEMCLTKIPNHGYRPVCVAYILNEHNAIYQQTLPHRTLLPCTNISACVLLTTLLLKVICFADGGCGLLLFSAAMERPICTTAEPFSVNSMIGNTSALLESRCGTIRNLCWFSSICYRSNMVLRREEKECEAMRDGTKKN